MTDKQRDLMIEVLHTTFNRSQPLVLSIYQMDLIFDNFCVKLINKNEKESTF